MARRDKYSMLVWLRKLPGDPADGRLAAPPQPRMGFLSYVEDLTVQHDLWIEVEYTNGAYRLRCYPLMNNQSNSVPKICASYAGKQLIRLLAAASADYTAYLAKPQDALMGPLEHIRWVE
jgi:hypothetical protein